MAVYERTYRPYTGPLTPERTRFLVLPRYSYAEVFHSKLFIGFFVACYVWPLVLSVLIYLPYNLSLLELIKLQAGDLLAFFRFDANWFHDWFMLPYRFVAFFMAFIVGPALVSGDLRNNGLPLYLSRPFSRTEYVLGKATVMVVLLSAVTWVPGLLLFFFRAYLGGWGWFVDNLRIGFGIFVGSWIWIVIYCLVSLALSAYVKWKPAARAALIGVFFVAAALGSVLNLMLRTRWGRLIDIGSMGHLVTGHALGVPGSDDVPVWAAWLSLAAICGLCLLLLARKIKAYEVVR